MGPLFSVVTFSLIGELFAVYITEGLVFRQVPTDRPKALLPQAEPWTFLLETAGSGAVKLRIFLCILFLFFQSFEPTSSQSPAGRVGADTVKAESKTQQRAEQGALIFPPKGDIIPHVHVELFSLRDRRKRRRNKIFIGKLFLTSKHLF